MGLKNQMGLKNLFNRSKKKKKKSGKDSKSGDEDNTTATATATATTTTTATATTTEHESTVPESNPTKSNSETETHRVNPLDSRVRIEEELEQVFNKFDVNGDGKICSSELGSIMASLGHRPTEDELKNMIKEVDADGDGFIDLKEFIELNTKDIDSTEVLENLKDAFSVFDTDKNGLITAEELQNVLANLGEECAIAESRKMIAGADQDGDGMISFDEFKVMMMVGSHFDSVGSKKNKD